MVSPGVKPPYQCSRIVSHQTSPFNTFKNLQSQISPFPSRQYERPFIPDETGGYTKQGDDSHFQRDLGICIVQRDHAYCRVPAWQIGLPKISKTQANGYYLQVYSKKYV